MKKLALILSLVLILVCAAATAEMGPTLNFKLAENQPDGNPITEGMKMFAKLANEYTEGTVNIEVYANGALIDEASSVDQLQMATLDFSRSAARVGSFSSPEAIRLFFDWNARSAAAVFGP